MSAAVADAGPPHYLILLDQVSILHRLYGDIHTTESVIAELTQPETPGTIREWLASPPAWFHVHADPPVPIELVKKKYGDGERTAIPLAQSLGIDQLLCDDRKAVEEARRRGMVSIGTIGILIQADLRGWLSYPEQWARLRETPFRYNQQQADEWMRTYQRLAEQQQQREQEKGQGL
ncbi:MAG: DUF3368 domain-containing protein [Pseudomonadota bacterium]